MPKSNETAQDEAQVEAPSATTPDTPPSPVGAVPDTPSTKVAVAVAWPTDSFDPHVEGVPVLTRVAQPVKKSDLGAIEDAAFKVGDVRLIVT